LHYCTRCEKFLPEQKFYFRGDKKGSNRKVQNICRKCVVVKNKERRMKNPSKFKSYDLKRSFGIDIDTYNKMLIEQDFKCKICSSHQSELVRQLSVDHCHKTGFIRGLLCSLCNTGLGKFKDDPQLLINAINYLKTDLAGNTKVSGIYLVKNGG